MRLADLRSMAGIERTDLPIALFAGVAGLFGSYAVAGLTPGFVAGPIAGVLARTMPAPVVTFAIVVLGDLGAALNLLVALGLATALLAAASTLGLIAGRRMGFTGADVASVGALGWLSAILVTADPVGSVGAGLGAAAAVALAGLSRRVPSADPRFSPERRRLIGGLAGALLLGVLGAVFGRDVGATGSTGRGTDESSIDPELPGTTPEDLTEIRTRLREAREKSLDVPGIEPLVSRQFFQVDINAADPDLAPEDWLLSVTGAVENPGTYRFDDVVSMPTEHRFVTLRCVGETLNGKKMDNALWTGTPLAPLVDEAAPQSGCECVMLRAGDGYFEEFPIAALRRGFLAWGMNGRRLPRGHGHPVRALIPGHWGEINVKWLTEIEFLEREADGYWELRGWHGTGPVNTVAKLHAVNYLDDGRVQLGGHAYAGLRGIDRVEVSIDEGATWREATLSEPLPGEDVWRQWRYEYDPPADTHDAIVRAVDGEGVVQPREEQDSFPSGATGWVSRAVVP